MLRKFAYNALKMKGFTHMVIPGMQFSKLYNKHVKKMDYKRIAKIVKKYKYPKIHIEKIPGFATKAVRIDQDPNPLNGALASTITLSSTFC